MELEFKCYRKRPVTIRAAKLIEPIDIETLEGTMHGNVGDYLIIGVQNEKYPCRSDIFDQTYEAVEEEE